MCSNYITQQCIHAYGADACLLDMVAQLRSQAGHGGPNKLLIGLLVPLGLAGALDGLALGRKEGCLCCWLAACIGAAQLTWYLCSHCRTSTC